MSVSKLGPKSQRDEIKDLLVGLCRKVAVFWERSGPIQEAPWKQEDHESSACDPVDQADSYLKEQYSKNSVPSLAVLACREAER